MIGMNLKYLRGKYELSQEQLAEKLGVTRQTVAKWEKGDSLPDVMKCADIAMLFHVSLEAFVTCSLEGKQAKEETPQGKYIFGIVTVGERGQVVIPKQARQVYDIKPGDKLLAVGDSRGMALARMKGIPEGYLIEGM